MSRSTCSAAARVLFNAHLRARIWSFMRRGHRYVDLAPDGSGDRALVCGEFQFLERHPQLMLSNFIVCHEVFHWPSTQAIRWLMTHRSRDMAFLTEHFFDARYFHSGTYDFIAPFIPYDQLERAMRETALHYSPILPRRDLSAIHIANIKDKPHLHVMYGMFYGWKSSWENPLKIDSWCDALFQECSCVEERDAHLRMIFYVQYVAHRLRVFIGHYPRLFSAESLAKNNLKVLVDAVCSAGEKRYASD